MAKNKDEKKRLTFVSPLEAKQVRYILHVLNLQARKVVGEETQLLIGLGLKIPTNLQHPPPTFNPLCYSICISMSSVR